MSAPDRRAASHRPAGSRRISVKLTDRLPCLGIFITRDSRQRGFAMVRQSSPLCEDIRYGESQPAPGSETNILSFLRPHPSDQGSTALNLVYQAAEVFNGIEEQARKTEARAQSLCKSAVERLKLAEQRIEVAERARREIIHDAGCRLRDASKALTQAQARIVAAEDQAAASEYRAQAAEARLREAKQELLLVEEAIRDRLLGAHLDNGNVSATRYTAA